MFASVASHKALWHNWATSLSIFAEPTFGRTLVRRIFDSKLLKSLRGRLRLLPRYRCMRISKLLFHDVFDRYNKVRCTEAVACFRRRVIGASARDTSCEGRLPPEKSRSFVHTERHSRGTGSASTNNCIGDVNT